MEKEKKYFIDAYWPREPKASGRDDKALWYHKGKVGMAKRIQKGDRVLLYEIKKHPDHPGWKGSGKIFASAIASGELIKTPGTSIVGGRKWDIKMPIEMDLIVDRDKGVEWKRVQEILNLKPRDNLMHPPREIMEPQFRKIEDELKILVGDFAKELGSAIDERDEVIEGYREKWGIEGGKTIKTHIAYERDRNLVIEAKSEFIRKHGRLFCEICNLSLEDRYGNLGKNIVDIHHVIPVSQLETKTQVKISDLIPVCPNCHRIIHSKRPFLSVDEVRKSLRK